MNFSPELILAREAAKEAGQAILQYYKTSYQTWDKKDSSPVTEADLAAEKIILQKLKANSPYPVLSEETADDLRRLDSEFIWTVDPLDGTKDFLHQTGDFSVIIGLVQNDRPIAGVIYKPVTDEMYAAQKNQGAFYQKNNGPLQRLSASTKNSIPQMTVVISRMDMLPNDQQIANFLQVKEFLQCGSVGIKVGLLAKGECDLYYNTSSFTSEWDTGAPDILIEEAHGKMTDMDGQMLKYNQRDVKRLNGIVVSNGVVHEEIIKQINTFLQKR